MILAVRDPDRGEEVAREIGRSAEVVRLDLAELGSVRAAAREVTGRHERLDLLVNNAGVMAPPRRETATASSSSWAPTTSATSR